MRDDGERINEQWPPLADAFREIHRFILKALDGNAAAANALFQEYLNGELPDELLQISRSWVRDEQACTSDGNADPPASGRLAPVRSVDRRRSQRAGTSRDYRPHLQGASRASGGPEVAAGRAANEMGTSP